MQDLPQESWLPLTTAQDHLRGFFSSYGYRGLEPPLLEPTELFLRKSGGELAARMYTFTDPGGNRVSLRPEYTGSILRHYLENNTPYGAPARIQYAGPVFRYEEGPGAYRQFTQVGAEILGSASPMADAEVLSLSCTALSSLGLRGHWMEVGDLGLLHRLLESIGLSERATAYILASVNDLKDGDGGRARVEDRARQLQLLSDDSRQSHLGVVIGGMEEGEARELLHGLFEWAEAGSLGQRTPSEVVERLLRKLRGSDDPARLHRGLDIACKVAAVRGEPYASLEEVETIIKSSGLDQSAADPLKETMELLDPGQIDTEVVLDCGLVRGLPYYTGLVFEIRHPSLDTSLGGGGRYDGLARAMGSPSNVPALGFAYNLEQVLSALGQMQGGCSADTSSPKGVLVLAASHGAFKEALRHAQELHAGGRSVEVDVWAMSVDEALSYAASKGIAELIVVDDGGQRTVHQVGYAGEVPGRRE